MEKLEDFKKGVKAPFKSLKASLLTLSISSITFLGIALSSSIEYSVQMFSYGFSSGVTAVQTRIAGLYVNSGLVGIISVTLYSLLIGITLYNFTVQLKFSGVKMRGLSGIGPGFVAAGCAGCGVGIMTLLGLGGILAILPFNGQLIRLGGILILIYYIAETGNPRSCSIPS
jgi:hypothetical protein